MKYFVIEYRFPFQVVTDDLDEAMTKAGEGFKETFGIVPEKWHARVFEYGGEDQVGPIESFFNPAGNLVFQKDKNETRD